MKLQTFYFSKDEHGGQAFLIGDQLGNLLKCKCDQIPPAYQCNKEKLVIFTYEKYGKLAKKFTEYIDGLTKDNVLNVALIELSNTGNEGLAELTKTFEGKGINVVGTLPLVVKKGLFSAPKITDEQIKQAVDFSHKLAASMFDSIN